MRILAIDPGTRESAYIVFDSEEPPSRCEHDKIENARMIRVIGRTPCDALAVEMVQSFGMAVGASVFETCVWIGRFIQAYNWFTPGEATRIYRSEVKSHLCHSSRAKDANIRQALIDRFGAPGKKKDPGGTYGIKGDVWSALAVAVVFLDLHACVV